MAETNLSTFLHIIHDCMDDDLTFSGQELVRQLLDIQKIDFYSDEKLKSVYTGYRPLDPKDIESNTKKDKVSEFKTYFAGILDKNKAQLLFSKFGIEPDEKVDMALMCEAIGMQFQNFTRYGDLANTTVKSIYEVLIDSKGYAADPMANEKAINAAYQMLYNSISILCRINPSLDQISDVKEPIESFLLNISQVYGVLFARMNRIGRITYKGLREKAIRKNSEADKYIKMASEPGALPITLLRRVHVVAYDISKNDDYLVSGDALLDEEYTKDDLIKGLEGIEDLKHEIEIFFTEYTSYHLENEDANIVNDVYALVKITRYFLKELAKLLSINPDKDILAKIKEKYVEAQRLMINFAFDGSYYRPTKTIEYAVTIEQLLFDEDGNAYRGGDRKFNFNSSGASAVFYGKTFDETIKGFASRQIAMYQKFDDDPMNEILVINSDKTARLYMFATTCKAKAYRIIREIANTAMLDHAIAYVSQSIMIAREYSNEVLIMPSSQRTTTASGGTEFLSIFGGLWDRITSVEYLCSDLKKGIIEAKTDIEIKNFIMRPLGLAITKNRVMGYSYTSVFKDKEKEKPASE